MEAYARRLTFESIRLDLRVHQENERAAGHALAEAQTPYPSLAKARL